MVKGYGDGAESYEFPAYSRRHMTGISMLASVWGGKLQKWPEYRDI